MPDDKRPQTRRMMIIVAAALIALIAFNALSRRGDKEMTVPYSEFVGLVNEGKVTSAEVSGESVTFRSEGQPERKTIRPWGEDLVNGLVEKGVKVEVSSQSQPVILALISSLFPMALAGPQLLDAAQQWLSSHSDSPAGLVRTVAENRDAVARAVTAQEFDARA